MANVVPIFKKGDREGPGNYRPVFLTCIACKLLEHIVLSHLSPIFEGFLCPEQHGFRRGLSCATLLVSTTNSLMASIDRGVSMHAAVLDFSKAFDRVSHGLLDDKLHNIDIDTLIIKCISKFLSNRYQMVVINGDSSSLLAVTSGVPQGSFPGPSLCLVYVNDIGCSLRHSSISLFCR